MNNSSQRRLPGRVIKLFTGTAGVPPATARRSLAEEIEKLGSDKQSRYPQKRGRGAAAGETPDVMKRSQ